ncbi:MAG: alpha-mannosidase, partial [Planctomycetes bacterium]|nr:alpha-mannosidase [Planctomycetota bacterium]
RYMLAREYYPEEYAALKECIAAGRWHVTGGALDSIDTNLPSPESLMRHVLYGNGFFKREFGRRSCDIFLTDSFGYGYALPSVAAHSGLGFFTTQKLTWGSAAGIPFDLGLWEGVDGSTVVAALNPGTYMTDIGEDLSVSREWLDRIEAGGRRTGIYAGYLFYGVGDRGGAPLAESVRWLEKSIAGTGPVRVVSATPDQLYRDLKPREIARLPRYRGELLLSTHGTGCYTSQAAMKRWNRKNELLADAAERAAVTADWLGAAPYPGAKLSEAWIRFLWHQFHDDLPGTCIPQAYTFSWNDEIVALNQFSEVLADSSGAIIRAMDTSTAGTAVVVYNPLSIEREDAVEAEVRYVAAAPRQVRVFDDDGDEMPSQVLAAGPESVRVLFLARVPPVGFRLYDVRPADGPCAVDAGLKVTEGSLENRRYLVRLGEDGDVVSIRDKAAGRELLSAPLRLALFDDRSIEWPAWEIQYSDITAKPRGYVGGPARVRIVEHGPARATLEVERQAGESRFVQRISLVAGRPDGDAASPGGRIEFDAAIAWESRGTLLKAEFPLAVANPLATYDLGLGAITRGNNSEKLYEVPAQQWADVTDPKNEYGVAILNDSKYGWDKPDDRTLRLTLLHTPATGDQSYVDQATQDIGRHRTRYAVCGHKGDWRAAVPWEAARLNQPLVAFQAPDHDGPLGRVFSMLRTSTRQVAVRALKGADDGDEVILRLQELRGEPAKAVRVSMAGGITAAREVNAAEEPIGPATVRNGDLITDLKPWQPRTFAVQIGPPPAVVSSPVCRPLDLPYDIDVVSLDSDRTDGDFDGSGHSLPGELLPARLVSEGIAFEFGPTGADARNAVIARGQTLPLPEG